MKKWLYSFKFIILILLFLVFIFYYYTTKIKSKDGFQNKKNNDYHYPHFDISANYYNLTESERAKMKSINPDSVILNIGNNISDGIDMTNIPWDSENRGLLPSQILWGLVSREASASIFHKVFVAQQLAKIRAAEDGKYYYESAILHFGTADPIIGEGMKVADFIANFTGPLVIPIIGDKMGGSDPLFERELIDTSKTNQTSAARNMSDVIDPDTVTREVSKSMGVQYARTSHIVDTKNTKVTDPNIPNTAMTTNPSKDVQIKQSYQIKFKSSRLLGKLITIYFDWIELIPPPVGPILNGIYMIVIMPIVMAIALPVIAPKKGSNATVEILTGNVYASLASMSATALVSMLQPMNMLAQAATLAAALYGALAAYFQQIQAVPAGYMSMMEKMIQQTGHGSGDGKCPNGFVPLDQLWNASTELVISFVPIFGDLIDLLYPYLCIRKDATAVNDRAQNSIENIICIRDPYVLPKYMEQSWISSIFLQWPDYNNRLSTGTNVIGGKLRIVPNPTTIAGNQIINSLTIAGTVAAGGVGAAVAAATGGLNSILPPSRTQAYWSWSGFTNFNDIKNNPNNFYNLNVKLENFQHIKSYEYIGGRKSEGSPNPDRTFKFFYLDFSDPNILIEMAQFYYNYAIRKPQLGDDRTFTIEYIAKINYVTSSSLFTCDAMCEMISIKYDARSGKFISETRTYDSDRRFYFRWRPANGIGGACMTPTDIWGNGSDSNWRILDDAYDEAIHQLNDAIHFPTDPTEDPTGLISGDVLLSAYELYKEQKERCDGAANYIVATYPAFEYTLPNSVITKTLITKTLSVLKIDYETLLLSTTLTTGELGNDESVITRTNTVNLDTAETNYENALQRADPFYLDFKIIKDTARSNYIDVLGKLYMINEDPHIFFKNDLNYRGNIVTNLQSRMDAVIAARNALWDKHKRDSSTNPTEANINNLRYKYGNDDTFMINKYYDVTGCSHIDGAALAAVTPDVTYLESDIRFPCQFDVLPHLKRCENINITFDKCIDLSNISQVIQAVQRQKPNLRIKTIHSIKARGNNTCQYIWDEYDKETPAIIRQKTVNRILYQQDLSSCTFCLPEVIPAVGTSKVQRIFIDNSDNKVDVPEIVSRRYSDGSLMTGVIKHKFVEGTSNIQTSLTDLTVPDIGGVYHFFQPLNNYKNTNNKLAFIKANYSDPVLPPGDGEPVKTDPQSNQLYVPRYDINNNSRKLPDLVRPKKPIRISYPNTQESSLGPTTATNFSNYCSDPVNMSNFMLRYNRTNNSEMIVNIQRAFTTSPITCDYEIDVFSKDPVKKDMYDDAIIESGNTIPFLEGIITQIVKIDESGTKVRVASSTGFSKGMTVDLRYTITNTITYMINSANRSESLAPYNPALTTRSISQAIQGLRVITSIDISNSIHYITYSNDIDKIPLDIYYYPINDEVTANGSHTTQPLIKDIPSPPATIGKLTLKNTVTRKTVSYNMASPPTVQLTEPYLNTPFTYNSINPSGDGLEIRRTTSTLTGAYSNTGYNFSQPAKSNIDSIFGSNTTYYNDNLVTNYTSSMSNVLRNTSNFLKPIIQEIKLSNIPLGGGADRCATQTAGSDPTNVCSNPIYMQRIIDSYNNGNSPIGIFNQERNTMVKIIQASTADDNKCHLIFENKNEFFNLNSITYYNSNNSNTYTVTNSIKFMSFPMVSIGSACDFIPTRIPLNSVISNNTLSTYLPIKASDLTLSYSDNFPPPYKKSLRTSICQVGDTDTLYNNLISNYSNRVNSTDVSLNPLGITNPLRFTTISKLVTRIVGYDKIDYLINQSNSYNAESIKRVILRAKFDLAPYSADCSWSYIDNSFKVQISLLDTIVGSSRLNFTNQTFVDVIDTSSVTEGDTISPLFFYPEF